MVKRYAFTSDDEFTADAHGDWVAWEDYQSLQAALREALDALPDGARVAELRKQFLEEA